jgi:copper oxidase (laccase) domain-containing protein
MRPVPAALPESAVEFFPALSDISVVRHAFIGRVPEIDVATDRPEALARLDQTHRAVRKQLGLVKKSFVTAQQVHGHEIAVIDSALSGDRCFDGVDGLITNQPGVSLGIYVADCCAIFLVDPVRRGLGLIHSGKKGTELAIVEKAIRAMREHFASVPRELLVQLSPCIRPPHYEIDFASEIVRQVRAAGVEQIHDTGLCTACDLERYYSYRAERARTGRMLALLALR